MGFCPSCQKTYDGLDACPRDGSPLLGEVTESLSDPAEMVGRVLEKRYRIDAVLGVGGMAVVLRATHLFLERVVAVKLLRPEVVAVAELKRRFLREAKAASEFRHPRIVEILDFGVTPDGLHYLVMEVLEGETLHALVQRRGRLSSSEVASVGLQVLDAVGAVHSRGIVHRDIKPDNFMLTKPGDGDPVVKLLDFGLAKVFEEREGEKPDRITRSSAVVGSPHFMSPEQARGLPLDARSDLYAVGCIPYELATGRPPFEGRNSVEVMSKQLVEEVSPPSGLAPDLDRGLEGVILRCLDKEAARRYPSAEVAAREIRGLFPDADAGPSPVPVAGPSGGHGSTPRAPGGLPTPRALTAPAPPRRRSRRWVRAGIVGAAVAAAGLAGWALVPHGMDEPLPRDEPASRPVAPASAPAASGATGGPAVAARGPVPDPTPGTVRVRLSTDPSGASVVDGTGREVGRTPLVLERPRGSPSAALTLRMDGRRPASTSLSFDEDGERVVRLEPAPAAGIKARPKGGPKGGGKAAAGFIDPFANGGKP
jgi:serine/threonine-protein kinase